MQRGEIWLVELPPPIGGQGHEQTGNRPAVIVISNDSPETNPMTIIVPFTSQEAAERFPYVLKVQASQNNGLSDASILLVFQVRAISRSRLQKRIGRLEDHYLRDLNQQLRNLLDLSD